MHQTEVEVAIVGAGPVGLTAAALLGKLGVSCAVFERNTSTSFHPRGHVVNARTVEILRQLGLESALDAASLPIERHAGIGFVTSLAGAEIGRIVTRGNAELDALERSWSPVLKRSCPQDLLEPILRDLAETLPSVSVRFETEVTRLDQSDTGVELGWRSSGGQEGTCRAAYVIGADGPRSFTREAVGIAMHGESMGQQIGVYFHADLWRFVEDRPFLLWWIYNAKTTGVLISLDGRTRWTYNFPYASAENRSDYAPERCKDIILAAVGSHDVDIDIKSIVPWRMQARIADRMRQGRVLIAGDAAHPLPPTGGQGMNTGIADVHNLAWKLNLVLKGLAPPTLLETYNDERLPVAAFNVRQSARNAEKMAKSGLSGILALDPEIAARVELPEGEEIRKRLANAIPEQREHFDYPGQTFGYSYQSPIIVGAAAPEGERNVDTYEPSAAPGHRAPHFWTSHDGEVVSSIDLFDGRGFTLLAGAGGRHWLDAFRRVLDHTGLPGDVFLVGDAVTPDGSGTSWLDLYGLPPDGAVLVRPDGHVAWRGGDHFGPPEIVLTEALDLAAGRRQPTSTPTNTPKVTA